MQFEVAEPTIEEISGIVKTMRNGRATGGGDMENLVSNGGSSISYNTWCLEGKKNSKRLAAECYCPNPKTKKW